MPWIYTALNIRWEVIMQVCSILFHKFAKGSTVTLTRYVNTVEQWFKYEKRKIRIEQTLNVWKIPTISVTLNTLHSEFFWILTRSFQLEKKKYISYVCVVRFYWNSYLGNCSTSSKIRLNFFFQIPYLRRSKGMILKKPAQISWNQNLYWNIIVIKSIFQILQNSWF